ncbi:MAG: amidohydrolase family protein [Planctomycetota bacterium]
MRLNLTSTVLFAWLLPFCASALLAQEPDVPKPPPQEPAPVPAPVPAPAETDPAAGKPAADTPKADEPAATEAPPERAPRRGGRQRQRTVAVYASHVHPVSGQDIEDGVVLVRGDRIVAVGKQGEIEIPESAETVRCDGAHLYPGLVDASSDAFLDDAARNDASADAATEIRSALSLRQDREDALVASGITTAYVSNNRGTPWSGIAAIVRPKKGSFTVMPEKDLAGLGLQLAAAPTGTHPLDRQRAIEGAFGAFRGLDDYRKKFDEQQKALTKYATDFADYVAYHEKKNNKGEEKKPDEQKPAEGGKPAGGDAEKSPEAPAGNRPAGPGDTPRGDGPRGGRGGRRGRPGGEAPTPKPEDPKPEAPKPQDPKPQEPKPEPPKPDDQKPQDPKPPAKPTDSKPGESKPTEAKADDKPPERPKYPKLELRDPVKDSLLKVLDGTLPLRVTLVRPDEIRACLAAAREHKVPALVLENVLGGTSMSEALAEASVACVLTNTMASEQPEPFADFQGSALPKALHDSGVAFAIASGSGRRARALPLMAASAVGHGLDPSAALRAITLTPAEILGVQKDVGSLQAGKLADLLICDRPLLQSDCRVLAVWSAGTVQYEAAPSKQEPR